MFVWVFTGVGECLGIYENFILIKISDVRGGGFWRHSDNPGQTGRGGLKITILAGRPLLMPPKRRDLSLTVIY